MAENKGNPKQDELVAKLVKDAQAPPDALLLSGYVGASSEEGHTRLYFDPQLSDYVEIPNEAILHTQEIPKDQSPLGGTLVWIKRDAVLVHGKVGPNRLKARFLEGRIQQEFVKAQAAGVPGQPGVPLVTLPDAPGCRTEFGPVCPTLPAGICPTHAPIGCPTNPAICTHFGLQCPTHQFECTRLGPHCPTLAPSLCPTCAGPICPTHQPPCTHVGPNCPTAGPTIPAICCIPPTSPLHGCPPPTPLHGCPPPTPLLACPPSLHGVLCPSLEVLGCTRFGPECPIHTVLPPCPIHTAAPPCPVGSGPFCGGLGGSVACQPGGPAQVGPVLGAAHFAAAAQQPSIGCLTIPACSVNAPNCPTTDFACTVVGLNCPSQQGICTAFEPNCGTTQQFPCAQTPFCPPTQTPACPTHHVACTVDIRACINTANPQQCQIGSAFCPTPACPTRHLIACTIGGPACGITGPQCPIQSAFCPTPACPTHHVACTVALPACGVTPLCPIATATCPQSAFTPCFTHLVCTALPQCPIATAAACPPVSLACPQGPGGVGPGPVAGGFAQAAAAPAALHISSPVICQPAHTLFCPQTQHFVLCHPTILCHTQPVICLQVTHVGCPFPTQFCPSAFCPSGPACGGGFGGFGGINQ